MLVCRALDCVSLQRLRSSPFTAGYALGALAEPWAPLFSRVNIKEDARASGGRGAPVSLLHNAWSHDLRVVPNRVMHVLSIFGWTVGRELLNNKGLSTRLVISIQLLAPLLVIEKELGSLVEYRVIIGWTHQIGNKFLDSSTLQVLGAGTVFLLPFSNNMRHAGVGILQTSPYYLIWNCDREIKNHTLYTMWRSE